MDRSISLCFMTVQCLCWSSHFTVCWIFARFFWRKLFLVSFVVQQDACTYSGKCLQVSYVFWISSNSQGLDRSVQHDVWGWLKAHRIGGITSGVKQICLVHNFHKCAEAACSLWIYHAEHTATSLEWKMLSSKISAKTRRMLCREIPNSRPDTVSDSVSNLIWLQNCKIFTRVVCSYVTVYNIHCTYIGHSEHSGWVDWISYPILGVLL